MGRIFLGNPGGTRLFSCSVCQTVLSNGSELLNTHFTCSSGRAFLFNKVVNIKYGPIQDKRFRTGRYKFRNVSCKKCDAKLGWFYEFAFEKEQRDKEGLVVLELARIKDSREMQEEGEEDEIEEGELSN